VRPVNHRWGIMKDSLEIVESRKGYHLQWYLVEVDDMGGNLGDLPCNVSREKYLETCEEDERIAFLIAEKTATLRDEVDGFLWESKKAVTTALRDIKSSWSTQIKANKSKASSKILLEKYTKALSACLLAGVSREDLEQAWKTAAEMAWR